MRFRTCIFWKVTIVDSKFVPIFSSFKNKSKIAHQCTTRKKHSSCVNSIACFQWFFYFKELKAEITMWNKPALFCWSFLFVISKDFLQRNVGRGSFGVSFSVRRWKRIENFQESWQLHSLSGLFIAVASSVSNATQDQSKSAPDSKTMRRRSAEMQLSALSTEAWNILMPGVKSEGTLDVKRHPKGTVIKRPIDARNEASLHFPK